MRPPVEVVLADFARELERETDRLGAMICGAEPGEIVAPGTIAKLADLRAIVTTDHETKADFIARVKAILNR